MFQTLFAGKTEHAVPGTSAAPAGGADGPDASADDRSRQCEDPLHPRCIGRRGGLVERGSAKADQSEPGAPGRGGRHLLRLGDQPSHELGLRDLVDDLALDDEESLPLARRDAEVRLARLARTVHDAAHDRDADRRLQPLALERLVHLLRETEHVHLGATARRARDEIQPALPQTERLQDRRPDLDLLDGIVRERHTDRVADPLGEQRPDPDRALHAAHRHRAGLGDAEVQRVVAFLRELPIGLDHDERVRMLDRDLDVEEVLVLEDPRFVRERTRPTPPGSEPRSARAGPSRASPRSRRSGSARRAPSPPARSRAPCRRT